MAEIDQTNWEARCVSEIGQLTFGLGVGGASFRAEIVHERHRHRYEVNPTYLSVLGSNGLTFIGKDDKGERMEMFELDAGDHRDMWE